jgi:PAS domain S-box-containing protein
MPKRPGALRRLGLDQRAPFQRYVSLASTNDIFAQHRRPIFLILVSSWLAFMALTANHFVQGRWQQGVFTLTFLTLLFTNAIAFYRQKAAPIPATLVILTTLPALAMTMYRQELDGLVWAYPAILLFQFLAQRRTANICSLAVVVLAIGMSYIHLGAPIASRFGVTLFLVIVFTNIFSLISESQQNKEAVQRQRLDLLVRGTHAGIVEWDGIANKTTYSVRFMEMLGYAPDTDTRDWQFFNLLAPEDRAAMRGLFLDQLRQAAPLGSVRHQRSHDYRLMHAHGHAVWIHSEGIAVSGADGRTSRYVSSFMDISERIHAEQALRQSHQQLQEQALQLETQNKALREAIRVRESVERMARHDLKTPLNSIASVHRLMREARPLNAYEQEVLGMAERAALRVLSMVNLSLDLYQMEDGSYNLRPQPVDLGAVAQSVARDLKAHADSKNLLIQVERPARALFTSAEELLCYSMLANLLKNAVEAAPEGSTVRVTYGLHGDNVSLSLHNFGAVPPAIRQSFFAKYVTHGKTSGTGLGAYSARLMARVQGGELTMQSSDAEGTILTLVLPVLAAPQMPKQSSAAGTAVEAAAESSAPARFDALPPLAVLLVDDDNYNTLVLRSMLPSPPLRIETAINGRVALDAVKRQRPDVIFMDLEMPVMNGTEALRRIREWQHQQGQAKSLVIAFSAHDDTATRAACMAEGFDLYLSKPATQQEIYHSLAGQRSPGAATTSAAAQPGAVPAAVVVAAAPAWVVVDDDLMADIEGFLHSRRALVQEALSAIAAGEREPARRAAHKLAGSLAMYGFDWAASQASAIENAASAASLAMLASTAQALLQHLTDVQARAGNTGLATTVL